MKLVSFTPETSERTWRGKTVNEAGPLDVHHLASLSLFVSGRQAGEFSLRMEDWQLF